MTVSLRPLRRSDAGWLDTWLRSVAASVGYDADTSEKLFSHAHDTPSVRARVMLDDGEARGILVYRLHAPRRNAAIIELVATPPSASRRGIGMSAATIVENELRDAGTKVVLAPAPAQHGIAVYFWIRLGYHPLPRTEWPCERAGVAWLTRAL